MAEKLILFFEKLFHTLFGMVKILKGTTFRSRKKNPIAKDETCYILGNGPSLNKVLNGNKISFETENLFVVNGFGASELYTQIKPSFYILADPAYFVENINQSVQMKVDNLFVDLNEKTGWPVHFFVPFKAVKITREKFKENSNITVYGYNNVNTWKGFKWFDRWVYHNQWAIVSGFNVLMSAIHLAICIGFEKIYLLGVDHSWHKNVIVGEDNLLYEYDTHFYDEKPKLTPVLTEKKGIMRFEKYHEQLGGLKKTFESYHYIQDYAKYMDVKILNCTSGSYIDAFERYKL